MYASAAAVADMGAQEDRLHPRMLPPQLVHRLEHVGPRHLEVQKHDVGAGALDLPHQVVGGGEVPDVLHAGLDLETGPQARHRECVVVDAKDPEPPCGVRQRE